MLQRKTSIAASVIILAFFVAGPSSRVVQGQAKDQKLPQQVLIIRHAEKPPDKVNSVHLAPEGKQRAEALYQLFEPSTKRLKPFPTPDFIFAAKNSKSSHRSVETVTALSKKLNLTINASYPNEDFARLVRDIFQDPKYAGKTILICWHHGTAPQLASQLRAADAPASWKGTVFDRVWQITYDTKGRATFRNRPQQLLPLDAEK